MMTEPIAHVTDKVAPFKATFAVAIVLIPPLLSPDSTLEGSSVAG
jgi:hypothetical protein